jgi:hypothetical protein
VSNAGLKVTSGVERFFRDSDPFDLPRCSAREVGFSVNCRWPARESRFTDNPCSSGTSLLGGGHRPEPHLNHRGFVTALPDKPYVNVP